MVLENQEAHEGHPDLCPLKAGGRPPTCAGKQGAPLSPGGPPRCVCVRLLRLGPPPVGFRIHPTLLWPRLSSSSSLQKPYFQIQEGTQGRGACRDKPHCFLTTLLPTTSWSCRFSTNSLFPCLKAVKTCQLWFLFETCMLGAPVCRKLNIFSSVNES